MYDVVFISFKESNAQENLNQLKKLSRTVHHVQGVVGIANAHLEASRLASSDHFFIVDADNYVHDNFNFNQVADLELHPNSVHVWRCINPVNKLVYGFGGVKLFPKSLFKNMPEDYLDFTMTLAKAGYFIQKETASETRFNATPFEAWKGGFRECVKLTLELDKKFSDMTQSRLNTWKTHGHEALNGSWAILGASMGSEFAKEHPAEVRKINDFAWLQETFNTVKL
ncbi:glycosyltransferase family A protein [Bacteriovorax sp. PP10]|uniref:Glycosyltransferase family A protein n=1 Tax=Bacteriovorax antarcticus TaxID=3088717 RepID=A0ABU5VYH9_9BACT|nr:glycosyltransferase family A protein [Bacteriovorax sp. PP10]MEA9356655.1 glycosyltransferase family A protein [Bacteriovorax sp. PP10]